MSQCDSVSIKRTIKLDRISLIYAAIKVGEQYVLKRPDINAATANTYKMSQISLNCVCSEGTPHSSDKRKKFSLYNDEAMNSNLDFTIITYERTKSKDLIQKLMGFEIEVILLYLIAFRYLGVALLKKLFFDKVSLTWYTQLPNADKMLCLLDAIRLAQFEEDYLREELLFFMLIDIARNPDSLLQITGLLQEKQRQIVEPIIEEKNSPVKFRRDNIFEMKN